MAAATPTVSEPTSPGPGGDGDRIDVAKADASRAQRRLDRRDHLLEVRPRRDLGDDSTEARVLVHRTRHRLADQLDSSDERDARLVARALDSEYQGVHGTTLGALGRAGGIHAQSHDDGVGSLGLVVAPTHAHVLEPVVSVQAERLVVGHGDLQPRLGDPEAPSLREEVLHQETAEALAPGVRRHRDVHEVEGVAVEPVDGVPAERPVDLESRGIA